MFVGDVLEDLPQTNGVSMLDVVLFSGRNARTLARTHARRQASELTYRYPPSRRIYLLSSRV